MDAPDLYIQNEPTKDTSAADPLMSNGDAPRNNKTVSNIFLFTHNMFTNIATLSYVWVSDIY